MPGASHLLIYIDKCLHSIKILGACRALEILNFNGWLFYLYIHVPVSNISISCKGLLIEDNLFCNLLYIPSVALTNISETFLRDFCEANVSEFLEKFEVTFPWYYT